MATPLRADKIKTVANTIPSAFDDEVNELLKSGWQILDTHVAPSASQNVRLLSPTLVAVLVKQS